MREVSSALVDVVRQTTPRPWVGEGLQEELVEAARFHRIAPLVQVAYRDTAPEVGVLFQPDRMRAIATHLQASASLAQLMRILDGVDWVTFKGAVLSEHAHPVPGLRTYNDVDVLVDPADLREVSRRLLAAGWQVADYEDMLRNPSLPGEMHWLTPAGVYVDLHWSMINMAERRRLFRIVTTDLLSGRVLIPLGADEVWTLDPADTMVHTCLHAALSGANKLIYLLDVDRLVRRGVDWAEVAGRAEQWGASVQVALVLARSRRVLATPLPEDLPRLLRVPAALRVLVAAAARLAPVEDGRANAGLAKFVARAVRSSVRATVVAGVRNAGLWVKGRVRPEQSFSGERHGSDAEALEAYLSAVERTAARSKQGWVA
ncbi:MAG: nucleotidyltransferase family protein [Nocardioides sp.]|uniref:nucleotidyltransferase domain-containing protein n=1 Tax=Nocardioides sp. TaxID=35761 RepID=UPI003EFC755D